jgi:hypothetical protein
VFPYRPGDRVFAQWGTDDDELFFPATIRRVQNDGTYCVGYLDGSTEDDASAVCKPACRIRPDIVFSQPNKARTLKELGAGEPDPEEREDDTPARMAALIALRGCQVDSSIIDLPKKVAACQGVCICECERRNKAWAWSLRARVLCAVKRLVLSVHRRLRRAESHSRTQRGAKRLAPEGGPADSEGGDEVGWWFNYQIFTNRRATNSTFHPLRIGRAFER